MSSKRRSAKVREKSSRITTRRTVTCRVSVGMVYAGTIQPKRWSMSEILNSSWRLWSLRENATVGRHRPWRRC
ncbi:hypothetical protein U1Q18_015832 [Sarracenia purpurea var. burkii]